MFRQIYTWALVLSAASNVLASPVSHSSSKQNLQRDLVGRQFECPPGEDCGPGPECATIFCDLPACVDAPACQDVNSKRSAATTLVDRQFDCPPGVECGHGPVCTPDLCDLPGCADADVCQNDQARKRSAATDIVSPICDICIVGDNGVPVCGCATSSGGLERRGTEKMCPQYCIVTEDGETLCGCAAQN